VKKVLFLGLSVVALFSFNMVDGKMYKCKTEGLSFSDGNTTKNIPLTPKTEPLIKNSLKNFFEIKVKKIKNIVDIKVGKDEGNLTFVGKWRGYDRYQDVMSSIIFMPDKNSSTNNAALIIPSQRLIIFYKCQ